MTITSHIYTFRRDRWFYVCVETKAFLCAKIMRKLFGVKSKTIRITLSKTAFKGGKLLRFKRDNRYMAVTSKSRGNTWEHAMIRDAAYALSAIYGDECKLFVKVEDI